MYRDSHNKDKTGVRPIYLNNDILYWDGPRVAWMHDVGIEQCIITDAEEYQSCKLDTL